MLRSKEESIGSEQTDLSECRYHNLLRLQASRQPFRTYEEIAAPILKQWPWGDFRTIQEMVQLFGRHWSAPEVEAAVWKLVGDAAAAGRLPTGKKHEERAGFKA